ncbi:hypothetical protein [Paenibacillus montanisoli]|uniref:Uncharacterized protein n=1 Tax=Paenibacillus montanisoli TaxID=2081970 RepID=A0A328U2Y1_9BACL|nr:hypothetical protein [Paenibacillus montanisoli]RAP74334.1 hypothetical protein DL346_19810 [Paenibacillus montanisoli]
MTMLERTRIISSNSTTFVATDRATAIANARANSGTLATDVGRVAAQWPRLLPYANDNSGSFTKAPPSYVWGSSTTTPQLLFFAVSPSVFGLNTDNQVVLNLTVFCDNAHDVQIDLFDNTSGDLFTSLTPAGNLTDGLLDPNTGVVDDVPFNWLNVRYYSQFSTSVPASRNGHTFQLVVSFAAVNYSISPPSFNPAALAFAIDVYLSI